MLVGTKASGKRLRISNLDAPIKAPVVNKGLTLEKKKNLFDFRA